MKFSVFTTVAVIATVLGAESTQAQDADNECLWVVSAVEHSPLERDPAPPNYAECLLTDSASVSVVTGRIVRQANNDRTGPNCASPERTDIICFSGWHNIRIAISRTIAGPEVRGRITAIRSGDPLLGRSFLDRQEVFVVAPIADETQRELLEADFKLVSMSEPYFCIGVDPEEVGLEVSDLVASEDYDDFYCVASGSLLGD